MPEYPRSPFERTDTSITPKIDGNSINATIIGETTPSAGSFTQISGTINTESLSGAKTLVVTDYISQWLDPNGTNRDVTLPAESSSTNLIFIILNTANGTDENILVKDDSPATIKTLGPGMTGMFSCDGTSWKCENDIGVFYDNVSSNIGVGSTSPDAPMHIQGNVFPVGKFERVTADVHYTKGALGIKHTTTDDMEDGFGVSFSFFIEDVTGAENAIASISGVRDGTDDTGAIAIKPYLSGSPIESLLIGANYVTNYVGKRIHKTDAGADYNPSAITSDYIITVDTTAAARAVIISTEDRDSGTATNPRIFIIKDIAGGASVENITVSLETAGTIDGEANFIINSNYGSITLMVDGTNGYII